MQVKNSFNFNKNDIIRPTFMTLIVGAKSKHGIVLAGDKRSSDNNLGYDDTSVKIFKLNDRVAIGGAGNGFDSKAIIDLILAEPKLNELDVEEIKNLMFLKARQKQGEWYNPNNVYLLTIGAVQRPQYGFILVGYTHNNEARIYTFTAETSVPNEALQNYCQLGIVDISKYIFIKDYKENLNLEALGKLAASTVVETSKISTAVSSAFDLIEISAPIPSGQGK